MKAKDDNGPLNALAAECYRISDEHGFHDNDDAPGMFAEYCANLHGEVSELWEAYRKCNLGKPCDKASKMAEPLTCIEEELADILIRVLDTAHAHCVDMDRAVRIKSAYNETLEHMHGKVA